MAQDITIVTGVAGFLGSAVARVLAASGRRLRGVVRASSPRANLADFPGELVTADLRDPAAVRAAMMGAGELFHVAADYRLWAKDPEEIVRNNLAMTQAVMEAALAVRYGNYGMAFERVIRAQTAAQSLKLPLQKEFDAVVAPFQAQVGQAQAAAQHN